MSKMIQSYRRWRRTARQRRRICAATARCAQQDQEETCRARDQMGTPPDLFLMASASEAISSRLFTRAPATETSAAP